MIEYEMINTSQTATAAEPNQSPRRASVIVSSAGPSARVLRSGPIAG
jgi:hypothetical protein